MPTMAKSNNIRKRRDKQFEVAVKYIRESIDDPEPSTASRTTCVSTQQYQLQDAWQRFQSCQQELDDLDDEDLAQEAQALKDFGELNGRLKILAGKNQLSTCLTSSNHELETKSERTAVKLPDIQLPKFDGTIENWKSFYDTFLSAIDRNENLTQVQKYHYLRSSVTGKAERSISSLDITESNYTIAFNVLRNKFDFHR
ncbi:uncharacterized protein LOC132912052 [Bombus pascuorum]|uniref:uncharacterized protein LOC132912052 n=1 Tax=Bombus pascuorum TaxID=65598 RepID=UPI00298D732A|nr:uncharacterized protein LOC132912052 [Bombus pascuorum]